MGIDLGSHGEICVFVVYGPKTNIEKLVHLSFLTHASSYCSFAKRAK